MNRRLLVFAMIAVPMILVLVALQMRIDAAPPAQLIRDTRPTPAEPDPLTQPVTVSIRQQVPLTLVLSLNDRAINLAELPPTVPVTLSLAYEWMLTQTLTATLPSTVTLTFPEGVAESLPISLALGKVPSATVVVTALIVPEQPTPTATATATPTRSQPTATPSPTFTLSPTSPVTPTVALSPTVAVTATLAVTPTAVATATVPPLSSTVNITANLRAAPGTESEVIRQIGLGEPVVVAGVSADGTWYLLTNGAWIAVGLLDNTPANPPVVNDPLLTAIRATATAQASAITTATVTTTTVAATPTPRLLPTPTPTPQPIPPSVLVNANLRSGPGIEFDLIGGTTTGQLINIVARNEAGDWFLLDNGGWVSASLVANPPNLADVPVYNANAPTPAAPTATVTVTAPITAAATITATTSTTTTALTTATIPTTPTLGVLDSLYLVDANELIARYDRALAEIDRLVAQAGQNEALLQDAQWVQSMTTAIALLRASDARVRTLQPTARLQLLHTDLLAAADAFDTAATLLAQGVDEPNPARFDEAFAAIARGNLRLGAVGDRIQTLTP